jgi:TolB-like protein
MKRITTLIIILLILSVPFIVKASGAQEPSQKRSEHLAGEGIIVPPREIYIDSYISSIDYHYPKPDSGVGVSLYSGHRQISAFGQEEIVQIGIQGRETSFEELPPMNLSFVVDKSESMSRQDKIDWVKDAFDIFIERVRAKDYVSLVVFDDEAEIVFPPTQMRSIEDLMKFKDAVHSIIPGGGDNLEAGLMLGFQQVQANFRKFYSNRVLLLSDGTEFPGAAASGEEAVQPIFQMVENFNKTHINLSTIGVGTDYNLQLMRELAVKGGGSSRFISDREDMEKTFGSDLDRTVVPAARNLTMKLEFLQNVEILETWGYDNRVEGNTVNYFFDTLHNRDYETILVKVRILPLEIKGSTESRKLARFSLGYTDLKCKTQYQGPYYLEVNFVNIDSPLTGFSDGVVLQSGIMLHYAQALKKIGELYYAKKLRPAFDLVISARKEIENAKLRLGSKIFDNEIEVLDKYAAVLERESALSEAEIKRITAEEMIIPTAPGRSAEDNIKNMLREIRLVLESKENGSIAIPGFFAGEKNKTSLATVLDKTALAEIGKLSNIRIIGKERLNVILKEQGIAPSGLLSTENAVKVGKLLPVDYILTGAVVETNSRIVIFGRIINVEKASIESAAQVILPKN